MNNTSMGMGAMGGMGGMNPSMMMGMDPSMMGMGQGMNPAMMGMGMGMPGMGMGGGMGGMGMGGGMGPTSGGAMAGAMGGGDPANDRFYKTKMCHKWEQGNCPYGPTCKYAHGPGDMRQPGGPMTGAAAGARGNAAGKVMTPNGPPAGGMGMGMAMGGMGGPMQPRPPAGNAAGGGGGDKNAHWRTRLCDGFMQNGSCRYGDKCTFAHGHHQLRAPGGGGGGMQRAQGGGGSGGQKRGLDQGGAGNEANKRQRRAAGEEVQPPLHETLPGDELQLEEVKRKFWELQQEANKFAQETGFSVALFSVGGIFTQEDDTMEDPSCCLSSVKQKDPTASDHLKVAVLKHATGGVANNLITRGEITKFVAQRGVKAISDLWAAQQQQQDYPADQYQDQEQASA